MNAQNHTKNDSFARSLIGFGDLMRSFSADATFPPFDVEAESKNRVLVSVAAAGFAPDDLSVELDGRSLVISGKRAQLKNNDERSYIHRGIGRREFTRRFLLAEDWEVEGASHEHGIITVTVVKREPEKPEPQNIVIEKRGG